MIQEVLHGLLALRDAARAGRDKMKRTIEGVLDYAVFEALNSETIEKLDVLSTHTVVEGHNIETVEVRKMDATRISFVITGQVNVEFKYGSNSDVRNDIGLRQDDSYPFCAPVSSDAAKPLEIHSCEVVPKADCSSFYE